jgi:hypothetical protein
MLSFEQPRRAILYHLVYLGSWLSATIYAVWVSLQGHNGVEIRVIHL